MCNTYDENGQYVSELGKSSTLKDDPGNGGEAERLPSSIVDKVRERVQRPNMGEALNEIDRLCALAGGEDLGFDQTDADTVLEYFCALLDGIEELERLLEAQKVGHRESARQSTANLIRATAAESRCEELVKALREKFCPRPCNHRPDEFGVGDCVDAGECGCSALHALIPQKDGRDDLKEAEGVGK
ncbi:hypothetical protein BMW22_15955 [Rhizobium leguminosarum]|uniref:Uncharacterized protein n=2 Tax=Rhizobium leguminosarum TaxID=384 RepID=A0A1L3ZB53_RHILE|nr:hypothetical protein BMW22_15955 [Rhizobium leguminosarum]